MFNALTDKFQELFTKLNGKKVFTEDMLTEAVRDVRLALLDADVNYSVASTFVKKIKEKAVGKELLKSVSPKEQFVGIIHEELIELMGKEEVKLKLDGYPSVILMCGLQGSGKTTQTAKLAQFIKKEYKKKVLVVACDLQRPAAVLQLKKLASQVETPVFSIDGELDPVLVAKEALKFAKTEGVEVVILDTAGRLHIDDDLMSQLQKIKNFTQPQEVFFVASATTGQDAVKTAEQFDLKVGITGTILTMLDGNARAGAAMSITEVTKKPLRFEGIGEKITDFQPFNPRSMADRILGMGDIITLVRKAKDHIDEQETKELEEKLRKASFTYDDYLKQISKIKKMGSIKNLLKMIPGFSSMEGLDISDKEFVKLEAMILSMTIEERLGFDELLPARRRRIALGSGTTIEDVNRMVKGFKRLKQLMKEMPKMNKDFFKNSELMSKVGQGKSFF